MEVQFNNLTVSISGVKDPKSAYDKLCAALATMERGVIGVEWTTDTFAVAQDNGEWGDEQSTSLLFPE